MPAPRRQVAAGTGPENASSWRGCAGANTAGGGQHGGRATAPPRARCHVHTRVGHHSREGEATQVSAVVTHAMGATRAVEYHSAEERRDILTPAATWRNLAVLHAVAEARRKRPRDLTSVGAGFVRAGRRWCLAGERSPCFLGTGSVWEGGKF